MQNAPETILRGHKQPVLTINGNCPSDERSLIFSNILEAKETLHFVQAYKTAFGALRPLTCHGENQKGHRGSIAP